MQIIDRFFTDEDFLKIKSFIKNEIDNNYRLSTKAIDREDDYEISEEDVDLGLENSKLYTLKNEAKDFLLKEFINRGFLKSHILKENCILGYRECKFPYRSLWHRDRTTDWNEENPDYFGFSFYVHEEWKTEWGGIYCYKNKAEDSTGYFVEPIPNRLIISDLDEWHTVSMVVNKNIVRKSLNLFVPYSCKAL